MSILQRLFGIDVHHLHPAKPAFVLPEPDAIETPAPVMATVIGDTRAPSAAKIEANITRFERAIAQCEKGEGRLAELELNLRYWQALAAAHALKPE